MAPPPPPKRSSADRSSFGRRSSGSLDEKPDPKKPVAGPKAGPTPAEIEEQKKRDEKAAKARANRRSFTLQRFAMNDGMQDILGDMNNELVHGVDAEATPKKKMEAVMINAKQRGMTVAQIFKLFLSRGDEEEEGSSKITDDDLDVELSPQDFGAALKKLGGRLFDVADSEMAGLIEEFDEDKNGTISLIEFRNWCYHIPHLAWKAERLRFEKGDDGSGSTSAKSAQSASTRSAKKKQEAAGSSPTKVAASATMNAKVTEVYKGTKLFWHTREKIEIVLSESKPLNCVILSTVNETSKKVMKPVFINLAVASSLIDADALADAKSKAMERTERETKKPGKPGQKLDMVAIAEIEDRVRKEMLANLVLLRLKLVDGAVVIQTLDSDDDEVRNGFVLDSDPGVPKADMPSFEVHDAVDFKAWHKNADDMNQLKAELQSATKSSDRAAVQLRRSLDAIERLKEMAASRHVVTGSAAKVRFYWALRRDTVKKQVEAVKNRIKTSPTYHALLAEQSAKGNTESQEIMKTLKASGSMP